MWSLVSLPIGQHILTPDWSSHGASWLVELWHPISWPTDLQIKIWQKYVITVEPPIGQLILAPDWSSQGDSWLVKILNQISQPTDLQIKIWHVITGDRRKSPIPHSSLKKNLNNWFKSFSDLKVLRYFCTELYLFLNVQGLFHDGFVYWLAFANISLSNPISESRTANGAKFPSLTNSAYSRIPPAATQGTRDCRRGRARSPAWASTVI